MASYFQNNRDIDSPLNDNRFNHLINKLEIFYLTFIERTSTLSILAQNDRFIDYIGILLVHDVWHNDETLLQSLRFDLRFHRRQSIFGQATTTRSDELKKEENDRKVFCHVCHELALLNPDRRRPGHKFHRLSIKSETLELIRFCLLLLRLVVLIAVVRSIKATMAGGGNPLRTNLEMYRTIRHASKETIENFSSATSDNYQPAVVNVTRSATSVDIDTKFLRQMSKTTTRTSTDDLYRVDGRSRSARSCSPRQTASARRRFSSSFDRAGRKVVVDSMTNRLNESFDDSPTTTTTSDIDYTSPILVSVGGPTGRSSLSRASPKEQRGCSTNNNDDKENESPKIADLLSSPKMKVSDNALAEQNSPRPFELSKTTTTGTTNRFTFSPRHIFGDEYHATGACAAVVAEHALSSTGSPLISSAVYKHGNYFRFPEVDCITPDNVSGSTGLTKLRPGGATNESAPAPGALKSQTSRRVRLKSISLDSDGARLVEDNLGVPVEELIEYTTAAETLAPNGAMATKSDEGFDHPQNTDEANSEHLTLTVPATKSGRMNKNNLKINIGSAATSSSAVKPDSSTLVKVQTPKTPTLTQTKQKAVSLDSSDANSMVGCCCSTSTSSSRKSHPAPGSRSTHHLSSISVPTTPKRNSALSRKKGQCHGAAGRPMPPKTGISIKSAVPYRQQHTPASITPLSESDCRLHQMMSDDDRSMRIAIDIDDNFGECAVDEMDDDVHIENFYMGEIDDDVVILAGQGVNKVAFLTDGDMKKRAKATGTDSCDYLLLGSNLPAQKFGMLSLSNNNLETLPEAMTLTDFECPASRDEPQTIVTISAHERRDEDVACVKRNNEDAKETVTKPTTARGNILQRRGSNQSLTINLNGSLGNLTKYMSASNYSLGSFTGSNYNLNACPQHLLSMCHQMQSNASSTQSVLTHGYGSSQTNILQPNTSPIRQQNSFEADASSSEVGVGTKKNLLQRRGSNTSLTLNIKGSSHANLSRFSSHSSLNISSAHTNVGSAKFKHGYHLSQQPPVSGGGGGGATVQPHHQQQSYHQLVRQQPVGKKGLLERRNSNASLTLNIHNNGLSSSSYNLRASACSLNNIPNMSIECYEQGGTHITGTLDQGSCDIESTGMTTGGAGGGLTTSREQRKYLSSDNLNTMMSQCNKLNQTHIRNSTKTCFGSVSDLKPNLTTTSGQVTPLSAEIPPSSSVHRLNDDVEGLVADLSAGAGSSMGSARGFEQSNLCSCTGVRNITTKPLSPQSTSEDFKMYLANIQLLQNATNVLTEEHLRKLHFIFKRYGYALQQPITIGDSTGATALEFFGVADGKSSSSARNPFQRQTCQDPGTSSDEHRFHFNTAVPPNDDEKRQMLRSLHEEFWDLPTNHQEKPLVFGSQSKNRYKTILPNEHSRVLLETETNGLHEPYINANYIKGPDYTKNSYIVTQGPLPNTIYDYWLMVRQNVARSQQRLKSSDLSTPMSWHSQKMVMLTNFIESNQQKCSIYFPIEVNDTIFITQSNEKFENDRLATLYKDHAARSSAGGRLEIEISTIGADSIRADEIPRTNYFLIENCGLHVRNGFSIRKFSCLYVVSKPDANRTGVVRQSLDRFTCYHYWFPDWPDHHSPEDVGLLLDMGLHLLDTCCDVDWKNRPAIRNEDEDDEEGDEEQEEEDGDHQSLLDTMLKISDRGDIEPMPIIHCSAGIGRTGCLAAILNGVRQMRSSIVAALKCWNNQITGEAIQALKSMKNLVNVDILGIVCNLRLQRGGMVQNSEQYELIHRALCLYQTRIDAELMRWTDKDKDRDTAKNGD